MFKICSKVFDSESSSNFVAIISASLALYSMNILSSSVCNEKVTIPDITFVYVVRCVVSTVLNTALRSVDLWFGWLVHFKVYYEKSQSKMFMF
jgi:hypothetical protein